MPCAECDATAIARRGDGVTLSNLLKFTPIQEKLYRV